MIDVFTNNAWVKSFTDKKAKAVLDSFTRIVNESKLKQNKLWVDQERLNDDNVLMYSSFNEVKSVGSCWEGFKNFEEQNL